MKSNSMFHKALFPTSLKARANLLKHFLDGQVSFKLNSLLSGGKKKCFSRKLLWFKHLPSGEKKPLFLLIGKSN